MYGSYESNQHIEMATFLESRETEFLFTLNCTTPSTPAQIFGPAENCFEGEAAEFDLDSVSVLDDEGNPVPITYQILEAVVGKEIAQSLLDAAGKDAIENGEF